MKYAIRRILALLTTVMMLFSLADGAYVGLPTDTWSFQTFRLSQYQDLVDRIAYGHVTVSADVSDFPPLHATNLYYYN